MRYGKDEFSWRWIALALALCAIGVLALARMRIDALEASFQTDARIAHRLLSQAAAQHDAVLAMLALLQPEAGNDGASRLPAIYPRILGVARAEPGSGWPDGLAQAGLAEAERLSRDQRHAVPAWPSLADGRIWLVLAATPASYALKLDLKAMVPATEWPASLGDATAVHLVHDDFDFPLSSQRPAPGFRLLAFTKPLATESQPFDLVLERSIGWSDLPWTAMLLWTAFAGVGCGLAWSYDRQRRGRTRAEELLRLGQTGRLSALGELSAGLAHELNQPLTAVMASTQAAGRLLDESPADLATAREAMAQAAGQARRAAEVLNRLRRLIERPGGPDAVRVVDLRESVDKTLDLLGPEFRSRSVQLSLQGDRRLTVSADPVGLEQIIHNLLTNAMHALEQVPQQERRVELSLSVADDRRFAIMKVADTGPGLPVDHLPRVFEPFFSTRPGGLGLGLSLCETLATSMGGRMAAANRPVRGAVFTLWLPHQAPDARDPERRA